MMNPQAAMAAALAAQSKATSKAAPAAKATPAATPAATAKAPAAASKAPSAAAAGAGASPAAGAGAGAAAGSGQSPASGGSPASTAAAAAAATAMLENAERYIILLQKTPEMKQLGLDISPAPNNMGVTVAGVKPGLVDNWNKENPNARVQKGDVIVEANGVSGYRNMLKVISSTDQLEIHLLRPRG